MWLNDKPPEPIRFGAATQPSEEQCSQAVPSVRIDPDVTEYSTRLMVPQPRGGYPDPYLEGEEDTPAIVLKRNMAQAAIVAVCIIIFAVNDRRVAGVSR